MVRTITEGRIAAVTRPQCTSAMLSRRLKAGGLRVSVIGFSALTDFEPRVYLVDYVDSAFAADHPASAVPALQTLQGIRNPHRPSPTARQNPIMPFWHQECVPQPERRSSLAAVYASAHGKSMAEPTWSRRLASAEAATPTALWSTWRKRAWRQRHDRILCYRGNPSLSFLWQSRLV